MRWLFALSFEYLRMVLLLVDSRDYGKPCVAGVPAFRPRVTLHGRIVGHQVQELADRSKKNESKAMEKKSN
jgi:hypothetical protein